MLVTAIYTAVPCAERETRLPIPASALAVLFSYVSDVPAAEGLNDASVFKNLHLDKKFIIIISFFFFFLPLGKVSSKAQPAGTLQNHRITESQNGGGWK